ncbi:HNH endonuclease [Arthrobacter cheniae]|uniref:HNH endonuclease n=1 Tax=Arthrobacter cheniae TaxID=1258888 RepID=A0A3A5M4X2_9MICC|nr:HNH endonuclease signature motif containing protein [Arthrobacter cheniae]RJT82122.1 HNH endonuclease [Arthrobacter cheniae]
MATNSEDLKNLEHITARITSLSAEKAHIDAELAIATEHMRVLFEHRLLTHLSQPTTRSPSGPVIKRPRTNLADTTTATELACLLRVSERTAHRLVQHAMLLINHHQPTLVALRAGTITWDHTTALLHEYAGLPHTTATRMEEALLPVAQVTTVSRLSYRARRLRTRLHPTALQDRARSATENRRIDVEPADDAMAWLHAYLPATDAAAIDARLTHTARALQTPRERRTLPQLRTDILTDLLLEDRPYPSDEQDHQLLDGRLEANRASSQSAASRSTAPPASSSSGNSGGSCGSTGSGGQRVRAHINVTVPVLTLLGVDDEPADLEGYGPIPADIARRLAAHAPSFTRILTHPETGTVLSVGRTSYAVPADLKKWLRVRDQTCRHPGCTTPASRCELDHTRPWSHHGTTSHNNLAHLCRKHHMLKSEGIWHYDQQSNGTLQARSPAGNTYYDTPNPLST